MKKRAEFRTEVKSRLKDEVYERMQLYKRVHGFESDSAALARLAEIALFGLVYGVVDQARIGGIK